MDVFVDYTATDKALAERYAKRRGWDEAADLIEDMDDDGQFLLRWATPNTPYWQALCCIAFETQMRTGVIL